MVLSNKQGNKCLALTSSKCEDRDIIGTTYALGCNENKPAAMAIANVLAVKLQRDCLDLCERSFVFLAQVGHHYFFDFCQVNICTDSLLHLLLTVV